MSERRSLTVTSQAGMCNRLRVLLSGKALAEATGRAFAMRWTPHPACGCTFDHVFENDWNVRANVFFDVRKAIDMTRTAWVAVPNFLESPETSLYVQSYGWLIQPPRRPDHLPLEKRCAELLAELVPIAPITKRIQAFRDAQFRSTMIGVHLRRGDHPRTRPDVAENLPLAMQHVDDWLDEKPDAGILLCTDDGAPDPYHGRAVAHENIAAQFRQRYGTRVVFTTPSSLDRRTPQAIQDGLVDLWLLRGTHYFVGTIGSSFSELAPFGRNIPFHQTAVGTPHYQTRVRWLKRLGIYEPLLRWGHREYGREVPFESLWRRYLIRLRVFLSGRI